LVNISLKDTGFLVSYLYVIFEFLRLDYPLFKVISIFSSFKINESELLTIYQEVIPIERVFDILQVNSLCSC